MNNSTVNASSVASPKHTDQCSENFYLQKFNEVCDECHDDIVETATEDYPAEVKVFYRLRK